MSSLRALEVLRYLTIRLNLLGLQHHIAACMLVDILWVQPFVSSIVRAIELGQRAAEQRVVGIARSARIDALLGQRSLCGQAGPSTTRCRLDRRHTRPPQAQQPPQQAASSFSTPLPVSFGPETLSHKGNPSTDFAADGFIVCNLGATASAAPWP
jgi:hypothetical protein